MRRVHFKATSMFRSLQVLIHCLNDGGSGLCRPSKISLPRTKSTCEGHWVSYALRNQLSKSGAKIS